MCPLPAVSTMASGFQAYSTARSRGAPYAFRSPIIAATTPRSASAIASLNPVTPSFAAASPAKHSSASGASLVTVSGSWIRAVTGSDRNSARSGSAGA